MAADPNTTEARAEPSSTRLRAVKEAFAIIRRSKSPIRDLMASGRAQRQARVDMTETTGLALGDRVRVNGTCKYHEFIGDERFVIGLTMQPNLTVDVWLSERWPPHVGDGEDGWSLAELDKLS